ncbi:hypothetical protein EN845_18630 [Mesorhizobium sp. M8A.F.Ca.ET.202.01.1.1]|nr:hypothetical protein EN845_18630 [Mesorhizobium sp. M8A.F.Ca.ET.202.01.1.1]TGR26932.1 hypothetical protein EN840_14020 [Mesorhizobium sp. M8A.F.Ca.ET.197.01.1.1]TGR42727.1 hypothetical protein EN842_32460 [bacterium M00.F.Ca.ET.199.01.1.1]TGR51484.1 hypothetical protein EN841_14010 [Mesorhizobium sp. M8A.F.Ca.ET.198.01.1.1]TGU30103.1 hypothetical protein EN799_32380 [bacterium M00.F.Ca.ET.156.01.1.1]TGV84831.1 hypothetical protein EN792_020610 [Mesorhizobium sp. M00.F.Ca.ET.149.01.1.1]
MGFSSRLLATSPGAGAAPHLPAGILSPYSDGGEGRSAPSALFCNAGSWRNDRRTALSPVAIRGEMPGRAMRGGANLRWTFTSFET